VSAVPATEAAPKWRALRILAALGTLSLLSAVVFGIFGTPQPPVSAGNNAFSRSALGHDALVSLLRESGVPVLVSRYRSAERAGQGNLLLLIEPAVEVEGSLEADLPTVLKTARNTLVVLPKRWGLPGLLQQEHIESSGLLSLEEVQSLTEVLELGASVLRLEEGQQATGWSGEMLRDTQPELDALQLLDAPLLTPLIACEQGVLLGVWEDGGRRLYVLSDPDLFATHGLVRGQNASLALNILQKLRPRSGALIIDETLHGFVQRPSLWQALFRFPLVLASISFGLTLLLVLWSGMRRFGAARDPRPQKPGGALALVQTTAQALDASVHGSGALSRYLLMSMRELAQALRAPRVRSQAQLEEWLSKLEPSRGTKLRLQTLQDDLRLLSLERKAAPERIIELATKIHRWKREMLYGPEHDSRALSPRP
jgi:hypothetical protein